MGRKNYMNGGSAASSAKKAPLGIDVQQIGAALAAVLVTELVNLVVEQLVQKISGSSDGDGDYQDEQPNERSGLPGQKQTASVSSAAQAVAAKASDQLEEIGPAVGNVVRSVRDSVGDSSGLAILVDALRSAGQQLQEKSLSRLGNTPEAVLEGLTGTAKTAVGTVAAPAAKLQNGAVSNLQINSPKASKKKDKKKKGKKKNKKK